VIIERLSLGILSFSVANIAQAGKSGRCPKAFQLTHFFPDRQRAIEELFRFLILLLVVAKGG